MTVPSSPHLHLRDDLDLRMKVLGHECPGGLSRAAGKKRGVCKGSSDVRSLQVFLTCKR